MISHFCDVSDAEGVTRQSPHSSHMQLHGTAAHKNRRTNLKIPGLEACFMLYCLSKANLLQMTGSLTIPVKGVHPER